MPDPVLVLTTLPTTMDAASFARQLVEERLAACVNLLPEMVSVYRWEGKVEQERERQVVIKTTRRQVDLLRERVLAVHPYELPEFVILAVLDGSEAYLRWIDDSTRA